MVAKQIFALDQEGIRIRMRGAWEIQTGSSGSLVKVPAGEEWEWV